LCCRLNQDAMPQRLDRRQTRSSTLTLHSMGKRNIKEISSVISLENVVVDRLLFM
jgi:hypothetical protein